MIGERAAVFASALEQSEQLMRAAEVVGPAAQPLPLFYALSQAGRAIAAVHLPDAGWRLAGHGLSAPLQDGVSDLVRRAIEPREESKKAVAAGRRSSFAGVTDAIGSEQLSGVVELGAVWAAMPDLIAPVPQMPSLHPAWRRPLRAYSALWNENDVRTAKLTTGRPLELLVAGLPVDPDPDVAFDADAMVEELSAYYPTSAGVAISVWRGGHHPALLRQWAPTGGSLPVFCWPDVRCPLRPEQMDAIAPDHRDRGIRLLLPRLNSLDFLSPLMLWWVLLFGLSSVARYDPELWVAALDVNRSKQAVPIEAALAEALITLPELILAALTQ